MTKAKLRGEKLPEKINTCDEPGCDKTWTRGGSMGTKTDGKKRCPMHFFRFMRGSDPTKAERVVGEGPRTPVMFRPSPQVFKCLQAWVKKERRHHLVSQGELVERALVAELERMGFKTKPPG